MQKKLASIQSEISAIESREKSKLAIDYRLQLNLIDGDDSGTRELRVERRISHAGKVVEDWVQMPGVNVMHVGPKDSLNFEMTVTEETFDEAEAAIVDRLLLEAEDEAAFVELVMCSSFRCL